MFLCLVVAVVVLVAFVLCWCLVGVVFALLSVLRLWCDLLCCDALCCVGVVFALCRVCIMFVLS